MFNKARVMSAAFSAAVSFGLLAPVSIRAAYGCGARAVPKKLISLSAFAVALMVFSVLVLTRPAGATTRYIAQTAGTFSGGSACNGQTTITPATFNGITNSAGDMDYICGTITGSAGSNLLTVHGNGSSGSPITIMFDTGAVLQAPYFSAATYGINGSGAQWVVIDGGANGIIRNTANGTGLTYQVGSTLIGGFGSNFTIKNLSLLNVYQHSINDGNGDGAWGLFLQGQSNVTVGPNNTFTQCDVCIEGDWSNASDSNWTIEGNSFSGGNQDMQFGFYPAGTFSNLYIYGNSATNWVNWDEPGNGYHHNFVHLFTNLPGATLTGNLFIYNNHAVGDIGAHSTSLIFLENNNSGTGGSMGPVHIFNNVLAKTNANVLTSTGLISALGEDNGFIVNNTISDAGGTGNNAYNCINIYQTGWTVENNVLVGCGTYIYQQGASIKANNNVYYGAASPQWIFQSAWDSTLASWQSSCSCDTASVTTNPNLNANYQPQSGSSAIGLGVNLSSLGIAPLNSDIAGTARPSIGAWIAGAFSNSSGSGPSAPVGLTGSVIAH